MKRPTARNKALQLVTGAEKTAHRLATDLRRRGYDSDEVTLVLAEFQERGWVDDNRAAEALFRQCLARGWGRGRIQQALFQNGIDREVASAFLAEHSDEDEMLRARDLLLKLRGSCHDPIRLVRAMVRRGFPVNLARRLVNE